MGKNGDGNNKWREKQVSDAAQGRVTGTQETVGGVERDQTIGGKMR